ncbi:MAG: hypothetical protein HY232_00460 [Acidobacteria bacterium]|nr:hypothetical protein [Acidobacteriota bacterium]
MGWPLALAWLLWAFAALPAQRSDDVRHRAAGETLRLKGGARVEFRTFPSSSLGHDQPYSIFIPPSYEREKSKRYPVVYFLHGLNNDHTSWTVDRYGRLHEKLEAMIRSGAVPGILMVHPKGDNSFYTNAVNGTGRYEDFLVKDLIRHIEKTFRTQGERTFRSIGGTSMGGYGALKLGMKYPHLFASVVGHSPIVFPQESPFEAMSNAKDSRFYGYFKGLFNAIYGDPIDRKHWAANNLLTLADDHRADFTKLRIYFDYGTADRYNATIKLDEGCRKLHELLEAHKVAHVFKVHAGEPHGWELVSNHFKESVPFLCRTFGETVGQ